MFLFFAIIVLFYFPALADTPPVPEAKVTTLESLKSQEAQYRDEEKKIAAQKQKAKDGLLSIREQSVTLARSVRRNKSEMETLSAQIDTLTSEQTALREALTQDRLAIARLISALEKLRRLPPQAMIAKPDAPIETARSAMLMQDILPTLSRKSEKLRLDIERLGALEADLKAQQDRALVTANKLKREQGELNSVLQKRESLYAQLNSDLQSRQAKVKAISAQAKTLGELVVRLEAERTRSQNLGTQKASIPLPKLGETQLPLNGVVQTRYNQTDSFGAKSKGVSIAGKGGAIIVAPMGGIVRFAGYFKSYGNMVILEHSKGYHSLIAGFEKVDTVVDQSVLAGEPLGKLYQAKNGNPPTLYFELRKNGKAINPAKKFKL